MTSTLTSTIYYLIIGILLFAIYGSVELSITDYNQKDVCPKIIGIPACYVVGFMFTIGLVTHIISRSKSNTLLFYLSVGIVCIMALKGTLSELSGIVVCPRTSGGTPMCYISFGICSVLLVLKTIEIFLPTIKNN